MWSWNNLFDLWNTKIIDEHTLPYTAASTAIYMFLHCSNMIFNTHNRLHLIGHYLHSLIFHRPQILNKPRKIEKRKKRKQTISQQIMNRYYLYKLQNNTILISALCPCKVTIVFKFHAKQLFCHEFQTILRDYRNYLSMCPAYQWYPNYLLQNSYLLSTN